MSEKLYMFDLDRFQVSNYTKIGYHSYYKDDILICTDTNRAARRKAARKDRLAKKHQEDHKDEKRQD